MPDYADFLFKLRNKKILGVNPPVRDFAFFDLWAKPLGLLYLLDELRTLGNHVELIDCIFEAKDKPKRFGRYIPRKTLIPKPDVYKAVPRKYYHFGLNEDEFAKRLKETEKPDLVLVTSVMTYWYPGVIWAIKLIKKIFPHTPVLLGGIYPRLCSTHAKLSGADMIQTQPLFLKFEKPAMDLYTNPHYGVTLTSIGCPLRCNYCASSILWPEHRKRNIQKIIKEIQWQLSLGNIEDVAFYDDALLVGKKEHFYPLCDNLISDLPPLRYHTPNGLHVKLIDKTCARYLKKTGFKTIRLSLEGIDENTLRASSYKADEVSFAQAVENLLEAGFTREELETYILIGVPGQTLGDIEKTIAFAHSLGVKVKTAQFSPIPGTPLFEKASDMEPQIRKEPLLHNNTVFCTYVSKLMTPEELQYIKNLAHNSI
ncbi:Radical SAM domain protein [Thermovirga lienii DSM 17291]|jgi:hypothetical protein|uniref:Radical SAM domain protein n=1 Tax=Thermovirga lienii (strain ATCC BAA-1197 / DSM 17291 / Cas60314) TaxID=580340 RepID=G7V5L6_THELD|nr:B12-binding domain-containing radical SAM protein [Thermovirga lienii]AER66926.1 Radical SAM domain protein [Thermovirga lienii DSM 17291]MDN5318056.1 hypothetical protein [Thermovirga sp.]MDN5367603.1 hypothetical protein [Thermovirga sp.]HCD71997.1 B12-binding domain-containing radical SAM protein [Thermovirga lienii]